MNIPLREYWNLLVRYLQPQWPRVALLAGLLLSTIALQLINPQIIRLFIDTAQQGGPTETLLVAAFLFIGLGLLASGLVIAATYVSETVAWAATNYLRRDVAAHCLRLDLSFHKRRTPGEMIERIDGDVTALANFFSQFVVHIVASLVLLVGVLVLLYREEWRVGVGLTLYALLALAVLIRIRNFATPYWTAAFEARALFYGFLGERLAGTEDLRANGATGYVMRRFYEILRSWVDVERKAGLAGNAMWMSHLAVLTAGQAVALGIGAYLYTTGTITIGAAFLIYTYTLLLLRPIEQIRGQLQNLQQASASIGRVKELLTTVSRVQDGIGQAIPPRALAVTFEAVTFGYDENEAVLHDMTFSLQAGRVLGLLGRTGSGKTSLTRLLLRLYDPQQGEIRLGGTPLRSALLDEVRQRVGMVTQDVQLFHATVRDNLTFFDRTMADEQILVTLNDLGLGTWYNTLSDGLDTMLASDGSGLSAGEAQLLAFARVFLKNPGLVILDEASSRLDPVTEHLIERAISKLLAGRTAILIAHRLATVYRADEIMILEGGRLVEQGDRTDLARDPTTRFYRLLQTGLEETLA